MIEPAFDFQALPDSVVLAEGRAIVSMRQQRVEGRAMIRARALPRSGIEILGRFSGLSDARKLQMSLSNGIEALSFNGLDIPGFQLSTGMEGDDLLLNWCPETQPLQIPADCQVRLSRVVFHLFGFLNIRRTRKGSLTLEDDEWSVTLQQIDGIEEVDKKNRSDGMCRLTHTGEIKRRDGASFTVSEIDEQLSLLRYFMALVRGAWCDPACVVGFDTSNDRAWESFSLPHCASHAIGSWFDYVHPEQMVGLFPLFVRTWRSSEQWRECLREVVYWYVNANTAGGVPGIDVSILLSQAALERLSHQLVVVDRRLISAEGFKSPQLKASDKLRMLLSSLGVPIDIPPSASDIKKNASRFKWSDGPHAFSDIRNALIHPDAINRKQRFECIADGWRMGLWYLELALLAVCSYKGTYGNRLTRGIYGQVEAVPWAKEGP